MKVTVRSELVHILMAAMEAAWLSPVLLAISFVIAEPDQVMLGFSLWLLLYVSRFVTRRMVGAQLDLGRSRLLLLYLVAVSMVIALKVQNYPNLSWLSTEWLRQLASDGFHLGPALGPVVLSVATVAYAWWRALQVAQERPHPAYLFRQFQVGLAALVGSTFLASRAGYAGQFLPWVFWFFFWGLLAIAVGRREDIARNRRASVETYWLPILLAVTGLVVVVGGVVSALYSRQILDTLLLLLQPVGQAFDLLLYVIAIPIGFLIELLLILLRPLLGPLLAELMRRMGRIQVQPAGNPLDELLKQQQRQTLHVPEPLVAVLKIALITLILLGVFLLLARSLRRWRADDEGDVEETHESVWSRAELWAALRALWRRLLNALGIGRQKVRSLAPAPATDEERAAHTVRQIYQRLMEMAAGLGRPRPPSSTPYEYLGNLVAVLPISRSDLAAITDAYVRARYGDAAEREDVEAVQLAWQRVKEEGAAVKAALAKEAKARRSRQEPSH